MVGIPACACPPVGRVGRGGKPHSTFSVAAMMIFQIGGYLGSKSRKGGIVAGSNVEQSVGPFEAQNYFLFFRYKVLVF